LFISKPFILKLPGSTPEISKCFCRYFFKASLTPRPRQKARAVNIGGLSAVSVQKEIARRKQKVKNKKLKSLTI